MYAVIESGNKQYRVELGTEIQVDRLDAQAGDSIKLDRILLIADGEETAIGQPVVEGATVSADVLRHERGDKIVVFKYKPKARTRVKKGFRAELTTLRISDIAFAGRSAAKDAKQTEAQQVKAAKETEAAAAAKAVADVELAAKLAVATETAPEAPAEQATPPEPKAPEPKAAKSKATTAKKTTTAASAKKTTKAASAKKAGDEPTADAEASASADEAAADASDDTKKDG